MKVACDQCDVVAHEEGLVNWVRTEPIGVSMRSFGSPDLHGRFCSARCVVVFFGRLLEADG